MQSANLLEKAYEKLEYLKGCMDAMYGLRGLGVPLEIPAMIENGLSLASKAFQDGNYESCLDVCNSTIKVVKEYGRTQGREALKRISEVG